MKRFTETAKWEKTWFQNLEPRMKLLWLYMCDKADAAGVWDVNLPLAGFSIGETFSEADLGAFGDRLEAFEEGKIWIKTFVFFQCNGELSPKCPAHKSIIKLLTKHGLIEKASLSVSIPIPMGKECIQEKEKEKEKEKDQKRKKKQEPKFEAEIDEILAHLNEQSGHAYTATAPTSSAIRARLSEKGVTKEGVLQMITSRCEKWVGTKYADYLRPSTLFGPEKFSNYYGQRNSVISDRSEAKPRVVDATGRKTEKWT